MNGEGEISKKLFKKRRDGLARQGTRNHNSNSNINSQLSIMTRKKKGLISKKVPDKFTMREYENNELSSKWDVKIRPFVENTTSINDDRHYLLGEDKKLAETRTLMGINSFQLKSLFFQKEEDLEEDNTKKMVTFFYHGKTFTYCKESCQLFKKEHLIRRLSVWITEWNFYKFLTFITILTMAVFMGLHNYGMSDSENMEAGGYSSIFSYTKFFYISYFAIEILLKIIARGLYQSPNSYLRNINNCIIIIIFGIITIYDTQFIFLLIFRIFYVFEFTSKFKYLRYSYTILKLYSISAESLCKLFFLIFFFITLFGILSTSIWSGTLDYRCRTTEQPGEGEWKLSDVNRLCGGRYTCSGNTYCGSNYSYTRTSTSYVDDSHMDEPIKHREFNYGITNFDNLLQSYLTLFQIFMVEGYYNIMYMLEDSHDVYIPVIFITCYFLVCTYFLNNLVIAIFFIKYQSIETEEEKKKQALKKKPGLVRFQGQQQNQDALTNNYSQNTNQNSLYNHKIGNQDNISKNANRIFPENIMNNKDALSGERAKRGVTIANPVFNAGIKKQKSRSMQDFYKITPFMTQKRRQKTHHEIEEFDNKIVRKKQELTFRQKPSLKSNNDDKDAIYNRERKHTYDNSVPDEAKKFRQYGMDIFDKMPISRADTNNKNNINHSFAFKANWSVSTIRKRNFSRIPFSPSMYGQSFINLMSSRNSLYGKNNNSHEQDSKDEWNEKIKDIFDIVLNNKIFIIFINFCILVNLIILSFNQYPAPSEDLNHILKRLNFVFIILFLVEDFMRLFQTQKSNYFLILIVEIIIDIISTVTVIKTQDLVPVSALKGLRILYAFTSVKSWVHYKILLDAMNHSMSSVLNIMLIAFSFMYLGTIIGMWLFGDKLKFNDDGQHDMNGHSPRFNFDDIFAAFTAVFAVIQGDYWNNIWMDCVRSVGGWTAHPYFIMLMIIGKIVFINSFTAIMLTSFEYAKKKAELGVRGAKAAIDHISHLRYKKKNQLFAIKKKLPKFMLNATPLENTEDLTKGKIASKSHNIIKMEDIDQESKEDENQKSSSIVSEKNYEDKKEIMRSKSLSQNKPLDLDCMVTEGAALITSPDQKPIDIREIKSPTANYKIVPLKKNSSEVVFENNKEQNILGKPKIQKLNDIAVPQPIFKGFQRTSTVVPEPIISSKKSSFSQNILNIRQKIKNQMLDKQSESAQSKEKKKLGAVGYYLKYCSCFVFHKDSFIRRGCTKIIQSSYWDNFFLFHIILSSIQLAMDNPLDDPETPFKYVLGIFNIYFTVIFCIESLFKIISHGFFYNFTTPNKAYMRSTWNILDLFINISAIIDQSGFLQTNSLKSLKSLRALRALRPLRIMTKNESLRLLVNALFQTIPILASLAFVTLTATWIFAIFLMSAFKGRFQYCSFQNIDKIVDEPFYKTIVTIEDCQINGGVWKNQYFNFDTIFLSVVSLFKIILGENWPILMWSSVDSTNIEHQPIEDKSREYQFLYYLLVFMGNIFTINLFTGLVVNNFKRIKDDISGYNTLTDIQQQWVEMQKFMMKRKLRVVIPNPQNIYRDFCFKLQKSPKFEKIIIFFIIVNLITMGCTYKGISEVGIDAINIVNNTCLVIYHIEAIIKIMGVGFYFYFKDDWNKFDFGVIAITDAVLFSSLFISTSALSNLPIIFRSLRLGRIVKYIRASHSLKVLIDSIYYLLPSLINIALLVFLLVFICAILGMNLFSQTMVVTKDSPYPFFDERVTYPYQYNFQTLAGSFLVILQCIQNQNWDWYMSLYGYDQADCVNQTYEEQQRDGIKGCANVLSFPFFIIIIFFIRYIVINLFLALVIEGFFDTLKESEAVISPDILESIIEKWSEYDQNGSGFIYPEEMYCLLLNIPEPIGLKNDNLQSQINTSHLQFSASSKEKKNKMPLIPKKKIFEDLSNFNVRLYSNDKTHFMDFCVKLSRNAIMRKAKENNISDPYLINGRIVIEDSLLESLMKNWEGEYPTLKKYNKRKDESNNPKKYFNILNYYAAITIQEYIRLTQRERKIKEQIMKNKLNSKMSKTDNANTFTVGNSQKPKILGRNFTKRQMSHIYVNQPSQTPLTTNSQPVHGQNDHPHLIQEENFHFDNFNLNLDKSDKGDKVIENTPQKLNHESKAKFFQKAIVATSGNQTNQIFGNNHKKGQDLENKNQNQENLKKFQHFHNFQIKKNQLGQKFPIKYATDYESLRPTELPRKVTIEEFTLIKNDDEDQSLRNRNNSKPMNSPSNRDKKYQINSTPKNLRIEGLSNINEYNQKEQFYQMRDKFSYNKDKSPANKKEFLEEGRDQDVINERNNLNNSNREDQNRSESHSTEIDPSLKSQKDTKKNNFFNN